MPILRNTRHEAFAQNLAKGMSATEAYAAAGYKPNRKNAQRLRTNEGIQERVRELMAPAVEETEIEVARVLKEMICCALYNPADFFDQDKDGNLVLKPLDELTEDQQRVLEVVLTKNRDGEVVTRITFADKSKALDQLARHLQMFKDTVVVENVFQVIQEMSDEELDRRIRELEDAIAGQTVPDIASGTSLEKLH